MNTKIYSKTSRKLITEVLALITIVILAFLLRSYKLGDEDFWVDEIGHIQAASSDSFGSVLNQVRIHDGAAPLDYLILHNYLSIIGSLPDSFYRLPYVVYGGFSVLLTYILARKIYGPGVGILSAFLLSISQFHIRYSQEVRFYSLSVLLSLISFIFLHNAIRKRTKQSWWIWGLINILSLYTFYYFAFLLFFQLVYIAFSFILRDENRSSDRKYNENISTDDLMNIAIVLITTLLFFVPWVAWDVFSTHNLSGSFSGLNFIFAVNEVGREINGSLNLALFLLVIVLNFKDSYSKLFLLIFCGSILGAFVIDASARYFFSPRQIIFSLPFFLIAVSAGLQKIITSIGKNQNRAMKIIGSLLILCLVLFAYIVPNGKRLVSYFENRQKPAWSNVVEYLASENEDIDIIVVFTSMEKKSLQYYLAKGIPSQVQQIYIPSSVAEYNRIIGEGAVYTIVSKYWINQIPKEVQTRFEDPKMNSVLLDNIYIVTPVPNY